MTSAVNQLPFLRPAGRAGEKPGAKGGDLGGFGDVLRSDKSGKQNQAAKQSAKTDSELSRLLRITARLDTQIDKEALEKAASQEPLGPAFDFPSLDIEEQPDEDGKPSGQESDEALDGLRTADQARPAMFPPFLLRAAASVDTATFKLAVANDAKKQVDADAAAATDAEADIQLPTDGSSDESAAPLILKTTAEKPAESKGQLTQLFTLQSLAPSEDAPGATPEPDTMQDKPTVRVSVLSEQSFPAPAQTISSPTIAGLASDIVAGLAAQGSEKPDATQLSNAARMPAPTHVMKIQLHPAELGAVTANMRLAGDLLSIEIQVQTQEAYQRLSGDSDSIISSLRTLGIDVDRVTVLQPSIAANGPARVDATGFAADQGGDRNAYAQANAGGGNSGLNGRQANGGSGDGRQDSQHASKPVDGRSGGGVYI